MNCACYIVNIDNEFCLLKIDNFADGLLQRYILSALAFFFSPLVLVEPFTIFHQTTDDRAR